MFELCAGAVAAGRPVANYGLDFDKDSFGQICDFPVYKLVC